MFLFLVLVPQKVDVRDVATAVNKYINEQEKAIAILSTHLPKSIESNQSLMVFGQKYSITADLSLYQNDSLLFYTGNRSLLDLPPSLYIQSSQIVFLQNGWYLFQKHTIDSVTLVSLSLIKNQYRLDNKFLSNQVAGDLDVPENIVFSDKVSDGAIPLLDAKGNEIGSVYANANFLDAKISLPRQLASFGLVLVLLFLLWQLASQIADKISFSAAVLALGIVLVTLRVVLIVSEVPLFSTQSDLFNPSVFASSFFARSLGQLGISLLFLGLWTAFFVYGLSIQKHRMNAAVSVMMSGAMGFQLFLLLWMYKALILDSQISLELYDVLSLSFFSVIAFFYILVCFAMLYFVVRGFVHVLSSSNSWVYIGLAIAIFSLFSFFMFDEMEAEIFIIGLVWIGVYWFVGFFVQSKGDSLFQWNFFVIHIVLASLLSMFLLENLYENKERQQRLYFGNKLLSAQDYLLEYSFLQLARELKTDRFVQSYVTKEGIPYKELKDRLSVLYFRDHFQNYDFDLYLIGKGEHGNKTLDTLNVIEVEKRAMQSSLAYKDTLVFLEDSLFVNGYLGLVSFIQDSSADATTLAVLFTPKLYNDHTVYPELLMGKQFSGLLTTSEYNYAVYINNRLSYQYGNFPYHFYWDKKLVATDVTSSFIETDEWEHLVLQDVGGVKRIMVSIAQEGFFEPLATFAYFFIIYTFVSIFCWLVLQFVKRWNNNEKNTDFIRISFRSKVQIALLSLVALSFVVIGIVTISFIKQQYDGYYTNRFTRKVKSILTGLEYTFQDPIVAEKLSSDKVLLEASKLSDVNNIDINLYDPNGWLVQSTRPEIFQQGLISKKIAPLAMDAFMSQDANQIVLQEHIGTLDYSSFYIPLRNRERKTIGYLHIPYFEKSNDVNKEVSSFLVTLLNVYAFLLLCAGIVSFFISNSITRPLRFISEKIKRINLEKTNEPIEWKSNDEIGRLISEYNKMIKALEGSAKELAKSERESAWRQMARQIAHEIKNPLTPMKLSIQYLQRAIDENNPNVGELAKKVNRTLIEQIDNLSSIATAFSSFAQMPRPNNEYINLNQILSDVVSLFEKESNHQIAFQSYCEDALVLADRNQLISVFNNLIKNAIQSLDETEDGQIEVIVLEEYGEVKVVIIDNGKGIPEDELEKVFVPNFTTKSSGTGLGLAISKQIIDMSRGKIWFESEVGIGTKFYVTLPHQSEPK